MNYKVSVIIPTYNGEKFIKNTLESCIKQTYENIEIIIIDDNSQDNTCKIISNIKEKYNNIKLIINNKNLGLAKNINNGYKISSGDFIISLGQDDVLEKNHIENMIKYCSSDTSFIHCNSNLIDEEGNFIKIYKEDKIQLRKNNRIIFNLSKNNFINSCGTLVNRLKALEVGLWTEFEKFPNYGEWLFWNKLALSGKVVYNNEIKSNYRKHKKNISNTFNKKENIFDLYEYFKICRKYLYKKGNLKYYEKLYLKLYYGISYVKNKLKYFFY